MMKLKHSLLRVVSAMLLAGAFVVVSATRADAGLIVYICDDAQCNDLGDALPGTPDIAIVDNDINDVTAGTDGLITILYAGGTIQFASSYPFQGSASEPFLSLNYTLNSTGYNTLGTPYLFAAMDGFTLSPGTANLQSNSSLGNLATNVYAGAGSFSFPNLAAPIMTCLTSTVGNCDSGNVPAASYYLAIEIRPTASTVAGPGFGGASGDATVTVVPDGGSTAALLGTVLMGFGMLRRRFGKA